MIYKGAIGQSLQKHFITALRLPLHPSAGIPNEPYNSNSKSPLSNAALVFVHAGLKFSKTQKKWLDNFPEKINKASASLLKWVQGLKITKPFHPPSMRLYVTQLYFCDLVIEHMLTWEEEDLLDQFSGPLWYRDWAEKGPEAEMEVCHEVLTVLNIIGARIIIVGHTIQHVRFLSF